MKNLGSLGQVQLAVLRFVASHAPITVADVAEHFARTEGKARTTVLTIMEQLRAKGFLTRRKVGGAFRYSPRFSQRDVVQNVIRQFISETLKGSVSPFIAYLAESKDLTDDELKTLKNLVRECDARRKDNG